MLEAIGLSTVESRLYTGLVEHPTATAAELAQECGIAGRVAARLLNQFVRQGLATRLPGRQSRYLAVAPDISIQPLLSRREDELQRVRAAVHSLAAAHQRAGRVTLPAEQVELVTGAENVLSRALALQEATQSLFRGINKTPYLMESPATNTPAEIRRLGEGIEYRVIYDRDSFTVPGMLAELRVSTERGEKCRVGVNAPLKLWMADDAIALVPVFPARFGVPAAFVVYPSVLLDALIALFEREWERAVPVGAWSPRGGGPPVVSGEVARPADIGTPADAPDETVRTLLGLLASGLTDEAIARSLGLSLRTVQRRIHDLMRQLGVVTRFQAGMAARERGWV